MAGVNTWAVPEPTTDNKVGKCNAGQKRAQPFSDEIVAERCREWHSYSASESLRTAHQKMKEFIAAGQDVTWIAFAPPGGSHWSVVTNQTFFNRNIPDECHQKMKRTNWDLAYSCNNLSEFPSIRVRFEAKNRLAWIPRVGDAIESNNG